MIVAPMTLLMEIVILKSEKAMMPIALSVDCLMKILSPMIGKLLNETVGYWYKLGLIL